MESLDLSQGQLISAGVVLLALNAVLMLGILVAKIVLRPRGETGPTAGLNQMLIGMMSDPLGWDVDDKSLWKTLGDAKVSVRFRDKMHPGMEMSGVADEVTSVSVGDVLLRPVHVGGGNNYQRLLVNAAKLRLIASNEKAQFEASNILQKVKMAR